MQTSRFATSRPRLPGLLLLLAMSVWALPADAAVRQFYFDRIASEHGLAQNTVTAIAQDDLGFVWIGTQGGLHRFDGQQYALYRHDPRDPASLPDSYVTALAATEGALWIGTYSQYVARLDLHSGLIQRFAPKVASATGDPGDYVLALLPLGQDLLVGTAEGLDRLDPRSGRRSRLMTLPSGVDARPQALLGDGDGTLWYATGNGLFRIDRGKPAVRIGPQRPVGSLLRDRAGRMWAGTADGLFLLGDRDTLVPIWPGKDDVGVAAGTSITAIEEAGDGRLWLSVAGDGLRRLDPRDGIVAVIREEHDIPASLPENSINALMVDRGGLLWVGGQYRGVAVTDPRGARFTYVASLDPIGPSDEAIDSSIHSIDESDAHALWLGTDQGRLLRYRPDAETFEDMSGLLPPANDAEGPPRRVMAFADAGGGRRWLATTRGLFLLDPARGQARAVPVDGNAAPNLRSIVGDGNGGLWLGTSRDGLVHFRPGMKARRYPFLDGDPRGLSNPTVHALLLDRRGRVWIGTGDGLDLLEPGSGTLRHFRQQVDDPGSLAGNLVRALYQAADGAIWVGTHSGLNRVVESATGKVRFAHPLAESFGERQESVVYSIREAPPGSLWLGTDTGLTRFDPASNRVRNYGLNDGLQDVEFNGGAAAMLDDGRLAFGGVRGFNLFDPATIVDSPYVPPVRLLSVRIGGQSDARGGSVWQPAELTMPEAAGILRLRVGALDYLSGSSIRYRYRMDPFDQDWIDNGNRRDITYTRLPSGHYVLRVQATNRDGVWNASGLDMPVVVTPPAWRQPLALAFYALMAGLAAMLLILQWRQRRRTERGYFRQIREREERLKLALWASGELFWDYDLVRNELHSMRVDEGAGGNPDIGVQTHVDEDHRVHPDDLPRVREMLRKHVRGESPLFLSEHRIHAGDEGWTWVRARGRVVERSPNGRALRVAGTARDISANRHADRERRIASEVLRSMSEAVSVLDTAFNFISVNPAFTHMTGYAHAEVIGRSADILDSSQHDPDFYRAMRDELERTGHWSGEMWQQRKDGDEFLCAIECSAILDGTGKRALYVAVLTDITDQKRAEQELRYLANFDTLTSLPNRALLSERLSRAIVRARRQDSRIAVLFLDLDRFKDINDSLGHAAGDRILRAAAARLQETVGAQHTVARLGGDEFTVVLENLDRPEESDKVAREIIMAFEAPLPIDERREVVISPSIGISLYPDHAQVPTDLLKQADTAMYQAKAAGRRTYTRYTEAMDVSIRERATMSSALRKVLDRGELRLVYQPRLSLQQARIIGVEALLRWKSEELGEIGPAEFIPLAEESGMILEIGEWALREACSTLNRWRQHGLDHLAVSVNVSALQLLRGDMPAVVRRVLQDTGVPADRLELELTESVVMSNPAQTADTLLAFRELGVALAIDDFGTGYSSLAYLKRLPITTLKIDKEFIGDLTQDPEDEAITSTIITMAHSLGLNVVAEGVETDEQAQYLREHGCDEVQGYWLSPPLEAQRCLGFIRTWNPTLTAAAAP